MRHFRASPSRSLNIQNSGRRKAVLLSVQSVNKSNPLSRSPARRRGFVIAIGAFLLIAALIGSVPALRWQGYQENRIACQTNMRRLSTALLLYAQDHESCFPPSQYVRSDGKWRTWVDVLDPYTGRRDLAECPINKAPGGLSAQFEFAYPYSYALNSRFFGAFGPGPFPLDNLEIPFKTALLVESGKRRKQSPFGPAYGSEVANTYWDTGADPLAYPSPHNGSMNVAAADGHVLGLRIAHYNLNGHDPQFGRLGGTIYNWNGGHPNGDTAGPPHE